MVRDGLMSREDALKRLKIENEIHPEIIDEIIKQMGLSSALRHKQIFNQ
ncbi:MAG: hypothetical protein ACPL28_04585 [bacterium]